jgi:3D (Asp-Asp-Asp) domain-containing protein
VDVDGEIREYIAEDVGGAVNGAHIDIAVETHDEANDKGIYTTTVWWRE